jgi:hypothetical protein
MSTIGTSIIALIQSIYITLADMPDLVLCNGPGKAFCVYLIPDIYLFIYFYEFFILLFPP